MGKVLKGRTVKLVDGGKGNSLTAFKAVDGKYYSSENAYLEIKQDKEDYKKAMELIADWIGYPPGTLINTYLIKRANEFRKSWGADVLLETILFTEDQIKWAMMNKEFDTESAMIGYLFAILKNNALTVYNKIQHEKKVKERQENTTAVVEDIKTVQPTKSRICDVSNLVGGIE